MHRNTSKAKLHFGPPRAECCTLSGALRQRRETERERERERERKRERERER